jgi:hypothetical protein
VIAGGAGGYIYDRMTGRGDADDQNISRDTASNRDLATRFGSPAFGGR